MSENIKQETQNQEAIIEQEQISSEILEGSSAQEEFQSETSGKEIEENGKVNPKDKNAKKNVKKKPEVIKTESLNWRCEQFFGKNWKYIFYFIAIAVLIVCWEVHSINNRMANLEKVVEENNGKVVMTTIDGRAIKVTKEPLRAELLKQFAASSLANNLIISRAAMTSDFKKNTFKDYAELLTNVKPLGTIYTEFLDTKKGEENKAAVGDFVAYLQWLLSAVAQDKLPEFIVAKDYSIDNYQYTNNNFIIEISIKAVTQNYLIVRDAYVVQDGVFKIYAEGSFSLSKSSDINPYGMRINRLKVNPLVKVKEK